MDPLYGDILTGINTSDTDILRQDTQSRINNLLSQVPDFHGIPETTNPALPSELAQTSRTALSETDKFWQDSYKNFNDYKKGKFINDQLYVLPETDTHKFTDMPFGFRLDRGDNEDFYARNENVWKELGKGIALKLPALILTKLGTGIGYTLGLANPYNWFQDNYISAAADNVIAKGFESLESSVKNDWLRTFNEAADRNKGFFGRLNDLEFWTEDAVDAVAFMGAAAAQTALGAELGLGTKLATTLGAGKAAASASKLISGLGNFALKNADFAATWALNTATEAMFEAKETRDTVYQQLMATGQYTDKEAKNISGDKARNTFLLNLGTLAVSNGWENALFFKALGKTTVAGSLKGRLSKTALDEAYDIEKASSKLGRLLESKPAFYVNKALEGIAVEGFYEENMQLAIQRAQQKGGGIGDVFSNFLHQAWDALQGTDKEAAMNIGMGGLIGGLFGTGAALKAREYSKEHLATQKLLALLEQGRNNWTQVGSIYTKGEDGNYSYDNSKVASVLFGQSASADELNKLEGINDPDVLAMKKKQIFSGLVSSHLQAGTFNTFMDQLGKLKTRPVDDIVKSGFDPFNNTKDEIDEYINFANKIKALRNTLDNTGVKTNADIYKREVLYRAGARIEALKQQVGKVDKLIAETSQRLDNPGVNDYFVEAYNLLNIKKMIAEKGEDKEFYEPYIKSLDKEMKALQKDSEDLYNKMKQDSEGFYSFENKERNKSPFMAEYIKHLTRKASLEVALDKDEDWFDSINSNRGGAFDKLHQDAQNEIQKVANEMAQEKQPEPEKPEQTKPPAETSESILLKEQAENEPKIPSYEELRNSIPEKPVLSPDEATNLRIAFNKAYQANKIDKTVGITADQFDALQGSVDTKEVFGPKVDSKEEHARKLKLNQDFLDKDKTLKVEGEPVEIPDETDESGVNLDETAPPPLPPDIPPGEVEKVELESTRENPIAWISSIKTVTQEEEQNEASEYTGLLIEDEYLQFKQKFLRRMIAGDINQDDYRIKFTQNKESYPQTKQAEGFLQSQPGSVAVIVDKQENEVKFNKDFKVSDEGRPVVFYITKDYWYDTNMEQHVQVAVNHGIKEQDVRQMYLHERKVLATIRAINANGIDVSGDIRFLSPGALRTESGTLRPTREILSGQNFTLDLIISPQSSPYINTYMNREVKKGGLYAFVKSPGEPDVPVRLIPNSFNQLGNYYNEFTELFRHNYQNREEAQAAADYLAKMMFFNMRTTPALAVHTADTEKGIVHKLGLVKDKKALSDEAFFAVLNDPAKRVNIDVASLRSGVLTTYFINKGKLDSRDINYNDFVLDNSSSTLRPILWTDLATGQPGPKIRFLNTYAILDPKLNLEQLEDVLKQKQEVPQPKEQKPKEAEDSSTLTKERLRRQKIQKDLKDLGDQLKELESRKTKNEQEGDYRVNYDQVLEINKWFKEDVAKISTIANSNAWATWTISGINLVENAPSGTAYHEAWHHFSQLYLNLKQKRSLYDEVRTRDIKFTSRDGRDLRTRSASDYDIEEFVADDFRDYVLSGGKSVLANRPQRNTLFRKILDFLNKFFFGKVNITRLYDQLRSGDLSTYKPSVNNAMWGKLNSSIVNKEGIEVLPVAKSSYYNSVIDALVAQQLINKGISPTYMRGDRRFAASVYRAVYDNLYENYYSPEVDKLNNEQEHNVELIDDLEKILANWSDVVNYHTVNTKLGYYIDQSLPDLTEEEFEHEQEKFSEDIDESEYGGDEKSESVWSDKNWDRTGKDKSSIQDASIEVKSLIRMLPKVTYLKGTFTVDKDTNGFPKLNEFSRTWNNLASELQGAPNYTAMYERLQNLDLQIKIPEVTELLKVIPKLNEDHNVDQMILITKFFRDFNKSYVGIYSGTMDYSKEHPSFFFNEETKRNVDSVVRYWNNKFLSMPSDHFSLNEGYVVYDEELQRLKLNNEVSFNFNMRNPNDRDKLMSILGIEFTPAVFERTTLAKKLPAALAAIQDNLNKRLALDEQFFNPINDLRKNYDKIKGMSGIINALATVEAKYTSITPSFSYMTAEGEMKHALMDNHYLSKITNALNNTSNYESLEYVPELKHLHDAVNPYMRYSYILKSMFYIGDDVVVPQISDYGDKRFIVSEGERFNTQLILGDYNGLKIITGKKTIAGSTTTLNDRNKIIFDFNSLLTKGAIEIMRTADSSTAYFFKLSNYPTGGFLPVKIANFKNGFRNPQFMNIMNDYLRMELYRMKYFADQTDVDKKVKDYSKDFIYFRDILRLGGHNTLKDKLKAGLSKDIDTLIGENQEQINQAIANFFTDQVASIVRQFNRESIGGEDIDQEILGIHGLDTLLRAFVANDFILNTEYTIIFDGDLVYQSEYKDFHKRSKGGISTGKIPLVDNVVSNFLKKREKHTFAGFLGSKNNDYQTYRTAVAEDYKTSSSYVDHGILEENIKKVSNISTEDLSRILNKYTSDLNIADGQGYITLDFYRQFLIQVGNWSAEQEVAYRKELARYRLENSHLNENYSAEDKAEDEAFLEKNKNIDSYFPPLKVQYNGPVDTKGTFAPVMDKFSLAPLIPSVVRGSRNETLNRNLIKNGIGYIKFASATKKYVGPTVKLYENGNRVDPNFDEYLPNVQYLSYLKEQINTDPSIKEESIFGSQVRKLIESGLFDGGVSSEKNLNRHKRYLNLLNEMREVGKKDLFDSLGLSVHNAKIVISDFQKLISKLHEQADLRDLNDNIKEYIQYDKDTHGFKYPLEAALNRASIQDMIMGIIDERLRRHKINGDTLIQISSAGFEPQDFKYKAASKEEAQKYGTNGLRFYELEYDKDGNPVATKPITVKIGIIGGFENLLALSHPDGKSIGTRERLNGLLKDDQWRKNHRKHITLIGYRIPTQGINSMEFMEVDEFLPPNVGSSIIVPAEIPAKTGSDFDIDKMFIFRPAFRKDGRFIEGNVEEGLKSQRISNDIISLFREILSDPENFMALITPNNVTMIRPICDKIAILTGKKNKSELGEASAYQATQILRYTNNLRKFSSLMTAKNLLGIFAVNNTFSQLLQQSGAKINDSYGPSGTKKIRLLLLSPEERKKILKNGEIDVSLRLDVTGVPKQEYFSQLINATVDAPSDDFFGYTNISYENAGVLSYLLHIGVPFDRAMLFLNHSVLQYYYSLLRSNSGTMNKKEIQGKLLEELGVTGLFYLDQNSGELKFSYQDLDDEINNVLSKGIGDKYFLSEAYLTKAAETRRQDLKDVVLKDMINAKVVLSYFLSLQEQANNLREVQSVLNFDTNKFATPIDVVSSLRREVTISDPSFGRNTNNIMKREYINKIKTLTPISAFNNKGLIYNIVERIMPVGYDGDFLGRAADTIDSIFGKRARQKASKVLSNDWIEFIVKTLGVYNKQHIFDLFTPMISGKNNMARRLINFKDDNRKEVDTHVSLQRLIPNIPSDKTNRNNIEFQRIFENTTHDQNRYIDEFRQLLHSNDPEVRNFTRDLIIFSFIQSGFNKSHISFQDIVPNSELADIFSQSLMHFLGRVSNNPASKKIFVENFLSQFQNNNKAVLKPGVRAGQPWRGKNYNLQRFTYPELSVVLPNLERPETFSQKDFEVLRQPAPKKEVVTYDKPYDRNALDPNYLYIYTENGDFTSGNNPIQNPKDPRFIGKRFPNQTQAVIRGLDNAAPIITKKGEGPTEQFKSTQEDFNLFVALNREMINSIKINLPAYKGIVVSTGGFATSKATLPRAFAEWLKTTLNKELGINTVIVPSGPGFGLKPEGHKSKDEGDLQNPTPEPLPPSRPIGTQGSLFNDETSEGGKPVKPVPKPTASGTNIYSGSNDPLSAALTNPTTLSKNKGNISKDYPINYKGKTYRDAEAAYKANKVNDIELAKQGLIDERNNKIMVDIITQKLRQYPELIEAITNKGGTPWLESSQHTVNGNRFEGKGRNSAFIRNLIQAYETLVDTLSAQQETQEPDIVFNEEQTPGYRERTIKNASADVTVAIAVDFNSRGELLTKSSVQSQKKLYIPIPAEDISTVEGLLKAAKDISNKIIELGKKEISLNIAGNGLYTKGVKPQATIDGEVKALLAGVQALLQKKGIEISSVRTGGQTGYDEAGAKAGRALGIPTTILAPKGWTFRNAQGQDISDEQQFKARFKRQSGNREYFKQINNITNEDVEKRRNDCG